MIKNNSVEIMFVAMYKSTFSFARWLSFIGSGIQVHDKQVKLVR
jgi:hypothetical protein